jgi:hypothetical protein
MTTQVVQPAGVIDGLRDLALEIGWEIVIRPGPADTVVVVVWEIATVSVNSRVDVRRQAAELVYIMSLLVERIERATAGPVLTFCQEAQVVDAVATHVNSELALPTLRTPEVGADVWAGIDSSEARKVEDLVARVARCIAEHVLPEP